MNYIRQHYFLIQFYYKPMSGEDARISLEGGEFFGNKTAGIFFDGQPRQ